MPADRLLFATRALLTCKCVTHNSAAARQRAARRNVGHFGANLSGGDLGEAAAERLSEQDRRRQVTSRNRVLTHWEGH